MSKKISLGAAIGLIFISIALTVVITISASGSIYNSILQYLPEKVQTYSMLEEVGNIVKSNYYGKIEQGDLNIATAEGYINGLGDAYSRYMSASQWAKYDATIQGKMTGIGIEYARSGNNIRIKKVYPGSPAEVSGLSKGDIIVAFDGEPLTKENYNDMVLKLEGDKLSTVNLTYKHSGEEKTVSVAMGYEAQSVEAHAIGQIGYIRISDFYATTKEQVQKAVDKFVSQEATAGIVLDLRDNSSTNFEAAISVIDIFVPTVEGTDSIARVTDASGKILSSYSSDAASVNLPIVVIINEGTLGGAELLATDLRDFGKAQIIGTRTAGMAVMQKVFKLTDGGVLLLSVGEITPYKSESYNNIGVKPDFEVTGKETDEISDDPLYIYAASLLEKDNSQEG